MFRIRDLTTNDFRYVTRSRAKVIDNNDPLARGRIRVEHPLLGQTVWIDYLNVPGMFSVPDIDDVVYVECDVGYKTHPIAWGNLTTGDDEPDIPEEFQRITPTNRGFYTPGGILIELDDGTGLTNVGQGIKITSATGNIISILDDETAAKGLITLETTGGLTLTLNGTTDEALIETNGGASVEINGVTDTIDISTDAGDSVVLNPQGITVTDVTENTITTSASGIKLKTAEGAELNLSGATVALGSSAAELLNLFNETLTQVSSILEQIEILTVPTVVGPSGPPVNSAAFVTIGTQITTIQTQLDLIKGSL
jgi:hypothetical protein